MSKYYSLTCKYIVKVPEEVKYEELHNDLSDILIEAVSSHNGQISGTLTLIRCNEEGHIKQDLK
jgi:hypothetical protein